MPWGTRRGWCPLFREDLIDASQPEHAPDMDEENESTASADDIKGALPQHVDVPGCVLEGDHKNSGVAARQHG